MASNTITEAQIQSVICRDHFRTDLAEQDTDGVWCPINAQRARAGHVEIEGFKFVRIGGGGSSYTVRNLASGESFDGCSESVAFAALRAAARNVIINRQRAA